MNSPIVDAVGQVAVLVAPAEGRVAVRHAQQNGPVGRQQGAQLAHEGDQLLGLDVLQHVEQHHQIEWRLSLVSASMSAATR